MGNKMDDKEENADRLKCGGMDSGRSNWEF